MHAIEKKGYGFKLVFGDAIGVEEMKKWVEESRKAVIGAPPKFGVMVDMRTLKPLTDDAQKAMVSGQQLYKGAGMERSAVILASASLALQFKRLAKESGIYAWERYFDAASNPDWEKKATDWISKGVDPDK